MLPPPALRIRIANSLFLSEPEYDAGRVADVILMASEAFRGSAQLSAIELRHNILHLNGFDRDSIC